MTVRVFAWLRDTFRDKELRIPLALAPDLRTLFRYLSTVQERGPSLMRDTQTAVTGLVVLLNGRQIDLGKGLEVALADGDEVAIFPPVTGG